MPKCYAPGCRNRHGEGPTLRFHTIPDPQKYPQRLDIISQWLTNIGRGDTIDNYRYGKHKNLCQDHFKPDCYKEVWNYPENTKRVRLKKDAVPTIFAPRQPVKSGRKRAVDLDRWPPDIRVPLATLDSFLTCGLCKGYLMNATTITVCLHTFCKACLVRHVTISLHCPICETMIHPTDPYVHMRPDSTMQDIVYKLLPQVEEEERKREKEFYVSRGLPYPPIDALGSLVKKEKTLVQDSSDNLVSVQLQFVGISPGLGPCQPLLKSYLHIPEYTTIGHLQTFIRQKMGLSKISKACLFVDTGMLHESLTVQRVARLFQGEELQVEDLLVLQYGVVLNKDYFAKDVTILPTPKDSAEDAVPTDALNRSLSTPTAEGTQPTDALNRSLSTPTAEDTQPTDALNLSLSTPTAEDTQPTDALNLSL